MERPITMIRQALILAGGRGTRLGVQTCTCPKPMLPVGGHPFLYYVIKNLSWFGITNIVLSVGYLASSIEDYFGNGNERGLRISYSHEKTPLGTGGGVKQAQRFLNDEFFVLNGDTLFDFNYLDLMTLRCQNKSVASIALYQVHDASRYGSVKLEGPMITGFGEKKDRGPGLVSGGVYAMASDIFDIIPEGSSSLECDIFPQIAQQGLLSARAYQGFFIDIGLPETLSQANSLIPEWERKQQNDGDQDTMNELEC